MALSLFFALLMAEGALRFLKKNITYNEMLGYNRYASPYWNNRNNWYVYDPLDTFSMLRKDFHYYRTTNSLGIPERELNLTGTGNTKKILCLGDSFTEGIGAPADSTWPRFLERYLNSACNDSFIVYNAGISGSDPIYEAHLLRGKLWDIDWHTVIFCINTTDIEDCKIRGGNERFFADSLVTYRQAPAWEPFYAASYLFRFVINNILRYDRVLMSEEKSKKLEADSAKAIWLTLQKAKTELDARGISLMVVVQPLKGEAETNSFHSNYMDSLLLLLSDLKPVNLLSYFADSLPRGQKSKDLYWITDNHFKPEGYKLMAWRIGKEFCVN
ncbi:MAG TPA: SGNH/GDSL hydrolase family protein [Chitinophagales bacterium]|nr:SGNH/GDSL hydrolase family protein [Chitinophagales bacterium]